MTNEHAKPGILYTKTISKKGKPVFSEYRQNYSVNIYVAYPRTSMTLFYVMASITN